MEENFLNMYLRNMVFGGYIVEGNIIYYNKSLESLNNDQYEQRFADDASKRKVISILNSGIKRIIEILTTVDLASFDERTDEDYQLYVSIEGKDHIAIVTFMDNFENSDIIDLSAEEYRVNYLEMKLIDGGFYLARQMDVMIDKSKFDFSNAKVVRSDSLYQTNKIMENLNDLWDLVFNQVLSSPIKYTDSLRLVTEPIDADSGTDRTVTAIRNLGIDISVEEFEDATTDVILVDNKVVFTGYARFNDILKLSLGQKVSKKQKKSCGCCC